MYTCTHVYTYTYTHIHTCIYTRVCPISKIVPVYAHACIQLSYDLLQVESEL